MIVGLGTLVDVATMCGVGVKVDVSCGGTTASFEGVGVCDGEGGKVWRHAVSAVLSRRFQSFVIAPFSPLARCARLISWVIATKRPRLNTPTFAPFALGAHK